MRREFKNVKRIVVKVGTSTLTYDNGKVNYDRVDKLVRVLSDLMNQGKEIVVVSSGAISVGTSKLNLTARPQKIKERQAMAAVGQSILMNIYGKLFAEYGYIIGQILLTRDVVDGEQKMINVQNTFECLIEKGIIPIVNENDSVSTDEIAAHPDETFSENDTLSAIVAKIIKADLLIILTDEDGLYESNPKNNPDAVMIYEVDSITSKIESFAGGRGTERGTGGMATKITAAKIATSAGVDMIITSGRNPLIINDIIKGDMIGTLFKKQQSMKGLS